MWPSLLAVAGTLAGALVSGLLQHRVRADARNERHREAWLDAVIGLTAALAAHRRAMVVLREAELTGALEERLRDLRDESHRTRAEVSDPAARVELLVGDEGVRAAAREAVQATYAIRDADGVSAVQEARRDALSATNALLDVARAHLAGVAS